MKIHPGIKPAVWGAVAGAAAISFVGFSQFGWTLGSTAERMAHDRADSAIVSVLAPICVERFQQQSDSAAKLIEFKKAASWDQRSLIEFKKAASWDQRSLIEKAGWATMPGTDKSNSAVATACADKLGRI
jgi:hypothetical protein